MTSSSSDGRIVIAERDVDALIAAVAAAVGDVIVTIPAGLSPLAARLMRAAVEGLAIERAPEQRINAIVAQDGAHPDDIAAGADYLASATSTTGQILTITARNGPVAG